MIANLVSNIRRVLVLVLVSGVAALANGVYSLTADSTTINQGGTVTFTAAVSGNTVLSINMNFTYDSTVLEFTGATWTASAEAVKNPITNDPAHLLALSRVILAYTGTSAYNGDLATLAFKVKDDAALGAAANAMVYAGGNQTSTAGLPISLTIVKLFNAGDTDPVVIDEDSGDTDVDVSDLLTDQGGTKVETATVTAVGAAANGTATLENGTIHYLPNPNFNGTDSFTYTATDGENVDTGTVNITVTAINDIPELRTTTAGSPWIDYTEQTGPVAVFTDVTVYDPDMDDASQTSYNGSIFYAMVDAGSQAGDTLLYPAAVRGDITLDGTDVLYQGTSIGTLARTTSDSFTVTLHAGGPAIGSAVVQALVKDLQFQNDSDAPSAADRTVRVFLDDAPGADAISDHLFESAFFFVNNSDGTAFLNFELATDASVRSVAVKGNAGATSGTMDQYNALSGMAGLDGVVGGEGWYRFDTPDGGAGQAEWDGEVVFATWAQMLAAFPDGDIQLVVTYWDGTTATLDITPASAPPAAAPAVPAFATGFPAAGADSIAVQWANTTGAGAATVLRTELEGPEIYDLDGQEFGTMKADGVWPATATTFTGLSTGVYRVDLYTGGILVDQRLSGVSSQVVWAALRETAVEVGTPFAITGTVTDSSGARADGDDLKINVHLVDTSSFWQYYDDVEGSFAASGPWTYSTKLAPVPGGYTHYIVQAYIDRNQNNQADTGEPYGESANLTAAGTYDITLTSMARGWARDWDLLGSASLYVTPVNDPPVNTAAPSIAGTVQYGQTVTADEGDWNDDLDYTDGAPAITDFAYQWYIRDAGRIDVSESAIAGATSRDLEIIAAYVGKQIAVKVTATDVGVGILPSRANASTSQMSSYTLVTQAPITLTADDKSKTYGDADPALTYRITSGALVGTDTIAGDLARDPGEDVGDYSITVGTLDAGASYAVTFVPGTLAIGAKPIEVTAADKGKTYGDADPALTYQVTAGVLEAGDAFAGALARDAGEAVGTYDITQGTLTAGANYDLTFVKGTLTIGQKAITVTADAQTKTYGDADPALTYQVAPALEGGDSFSGALSRDPGEDVGVYEITQGTLSAGGNYALTYVKSGLTITKKAITVTADAQTKTYGDADPALTYQVAPALEDGDSFSGALTRDAGEAVGTYDITQGTLSAGGNYNLTYVKDQLSITKKAVTVTADAQTKAYGEADPALTYQVAPALVVGDSFSGALTRDAGEAVGTYDITQGTLALGANYDLTYNGDQLTITKKAITVTADAQTKTYGDADPALTYQVSPALEAGDSLTGALTREVGETVGDYEIQQGTLAADANYSLTYVPADLAITKRDLGITADAKAKTYGDADPALTYQITSGSLVGLDGLMGDLTREAGEDVGTYAILQGTVSAGVNYNLSYTSADLTISARPITVTADGKTKTYGEDDPAFTYQLTSGSLAVGDVFAGALTREAGENVGDYEIQQGTLSVVVAPTRALPGNYDITYVPADLTITKASLTITADDKTRTYWQSNDDVEFSATFGEVPKRPDLMNGLVGGDVEGDFTLNLGTDAVDGSPWGGAYVTTVSVVNPTELPASNYAITTKTGTFTITSGSAPVANRTNTGEAPLLVVSGRTTTFDLNNFFDDADEANGDAIVFSALTAPTGGDGDETVAFVVRGGDVTFDPKDTVQGAGAPVAIQFTVKVTDSANPALLLDGTGDGVATVYLSLIDNQAPVVTEATPADADGDMSADDTEQLTIAEGDNVQVTVKASDATDPSGDDGINTINFAYQWAGDAVWTGFNAPARALAETGEASAMSDVLATDENSVTAAEGTKVLHVRAVITDGAGVTTTKLWDFTVTNQNLQPQIGAITGVTSVDEDNGGGVEELNVTIAGVTNGGETGDPDIAVVAPPTRIAAAFIKAESDRNDIVDESKIVLADVTPADRNGGERIFELVYELETDANGVATITVTVDDGSGAENATATKQFTITVAAVNDAPVNTVAPSITGTPHVGVELTAAPGTWDDDKDNAWIAEARADRGTTISFTYQWQYAGALNRPGWLDIAGATGATFTPTIAQTGMDIRVEVTATDNGYPGTASEVESSDPVRISNAQPTIADGDAKTIAGYEDNADPVLDRGVSYDGFRFPLSASDTDGDALTWSVSTEPSYGQASVDEVGNVVYTPNANYYNAGTLATRNGGESFVVKIDDGLGGTDEITITVHVAAVNDAPEFTTLRLAAYDDARGEVSTSKPEEIAMLVAQVGDIVDVDDTEFTFGYVWTVERANDMRGSTEIDTGDVGELTTTDLNNNGLGTAFMKDDRVRVAVTVTDSGGGQLYGLPAELSATKEKEILLGSPAWFPQVSLRSVLADFVGPDGGEDFYEMTFALNGQTVVTVVIRVTADKDVPWPAEYLAANWPYTVKGLRWGLTYTIARVRKFDQANGMWVVQPLASAEVRVGEPQVTVEEYDAPTVESEQAGALTRLQNGEGDYTGDYEAQFSLDSASGYLYTWVGPGTNVEEVVLFDAEPDGTFPTTQDLSLVVNGITQPGLYVLTVIPLNPESQFANTVYGAADQEVWQLDIDQDEIDENNGNQTVPEADVWGMNPGWNDEDGDGNNDFTRENPEYVGTLAEGQDGLDLTLRWKAIPDTTRYYLLVADAAGVPLRMYNRIPVGTLPRAAVFLPAGRYQWRVTATNAAGARDWSPIAWFQVMGLGDQADEIAAAERYTPFVDGAVAANVVWGRGAELDLGCTIEVGEAHTLAVHVYITSGTTVVYDRWLAVGAVGRGAVAFSTSLGVGDGLTIAQNTQYTVSLMPRNTVYGTVYNGPWSSPARVASGAPAGGFDFTVVTGPTYSGSRMVFDFTGSGVAAADVIEYNVAITRNGKVKKSKGKLSAANIVGNMLTLPTTVRDGDRVVVTMRVKHEGVWTDWRVFLATVSLE